MRELHLPQGSQSAANWKYQRRCWNAIWYALQIVLKSLLEVLGNWQECQVKDEAAASFPWAPSVLNAAITTITLWSRAKGSADIIHASHLLKFNMGINPCSDPDSSLSWLNCLKQFSFIMQIVYRLLLPTEVPTAASPKGNITDSSENPK